MLREAAAQRAWGGSCLESRPGLIVGPHDRTGRFTWWRQRLQRGGEVLAPGDPTTPVQFIDVRDLAPWHLTQAEAGSAGVFNLVGPTEPLTIVGLLQAARHGGLGARPRHAGMGLAPEREAALLQAWAALAAN